MTTLFDAKVKDNAAKVGYPTIEAEPGYMPLEIEVYAKSPYNDEDMMRTTMKILDCAPRVHMDTGQIKYKDMRRDQIVQTTAGKFARKFLTDSDGNNLSDKAIQAFSELVKTYCDRYEVRFTSDAIDMAKVYRNGPRSCMSGGSVMHYSPQLGREVHPAEVYATPDFQLAYAVDKSNDDKIVSRCVISKVNNTYGVIYGLASVMMSEFAKNDITAAPGSKPFKGHRLQRILVDEYDETYLMPYVDGHCYLRNADDDYFSLNGDWDSHHEECDKTTGTTSDDQNMFCCEHCDDSIHEDEAVHIELYCGDTIAICEYCYSEDFVNDGDDMYVYHNVNDSDVIEVDGEYYHNESDSIFYSDRDECWKLTDDYDSDYENYEDDDDDLDDDDGLDVAHKRCKCSKCEAVVLESEIINIYVASRGYGNFEVRSKNVCTACYLNKYGIANDWYVFDGLKIVDYETRDLLAIYAGYNDLYYDLQNLNSGAIHKSDDQYIVTHELLAQIRQDAEAAKLQYAII